MKIFIASCAALALAAALTFAPISAPHAYKATTGVALHKACGGVAPHVCLSYLAGIVDMHEIGLANGEARLFCPRLEEPEKVGRGVWLYYETNPDALSQPAVLGAIQALAFMFPCE